MGALLRDLSLTILAVALQHYEEVLELHPDHEEVRLSRSRYTRHRAPQPRFSVAVFARGCPVVQPPTPTEEPRTLASQQSLSFTIPQARAELDALLLKRARERAAAGLPAESEAAAAVLAEEAAAAARITGGAAALCSKLFDTLDEDDSGYLEGKSRVNYPGGAPFDYPPQTQHADATWINCRAGGEGIPAHPWRGTRGG